MRASGAFFAVFAHVAAAVAANAMLELVHEVCAALLHDQHKQVIKDARRHKPSGNGTSKWLSDDAGD